MPLFMSAYVSVGVGDPNASHGAPHDLSYAFPLDEDPIDFLFKQSIKRGKMAGFGVVAFGELEGVQEIADFRKGLTGGLGEFESFLISAAETSLQ